MRTPKNNLPEQLELFPYGENGVPVGMEHSSPSPAEAGTRNHITLHHPSSSFEAVLVDTRKVTPKALAETLHRDLENATGRIITLKITNNTSNMMSVALDAASGIVRLRLHHMFLDAPGEIRHALAHWIKHPKSRKYGECFRSFITSRHHQIRKTTMTPAAIRSRGAVHDLNTFFNDLNAEYFNSGLDVSITWGRESCSPMRSIRFGSYYEAARLIRIHPRLDQAFIPSFIVRYIVYHEMLHAQLGICRNEKGRRQVHPKQFKEIERRFPDYDRAVAWIENPDNLNRILKTRKLKRHK